LLIAFLGHVRQTYRAVTTWIKQVKVKIKQSHYRPGVAQRVAAS